MSQEHCIGDMCEAFEVSASGYYDWRKAQEQPCRRTQQDRQLAEAIVTIHRQNLETYGAPRIQMQLRQDGQRHGRNRIARLMREQNICGRQKKRFRIRTTDSHHDEPIAPNRLVKTAPPQKPDRIWVADITYVATAQGWVYVAAVLDLYSRRIVGWAVSQEINTVLVLAALKMALCHRQPPCGLIFHSDRGVQYASRDYRHALEAASLVASMSRKANCYDNAAMESFWSTLKLELIYRRRFENLAQVREAVFEYIETFYNRRRLHSALGYQSPEAFELSKN